MKRALIEEATNRVVEITSVGGDFDVHTGLYWTDCPDNVETFWLLLADGSYEDPHADTRDEFGNPVEPWIMQRMRAYAPSGDQMDMLYKELASTGTISKDGTWFKHITEVKASLPKPVVYDADARRR